MSVEPDTGIWQLTQLICFWAGPAEFACMSFITLGSEQVFRSGWWWQLLQASLNTSLLVSRTLTCGLWQVTQVRAPLYGFSAFLPAAAFSYDCIKQALCFRRSACEA